MEICVCPAVKIDGLMYSFADGKRYNSFAVHFRKAYGERLQKIVIDAGFTCPNRDGTAGRGGCTYCDNAAFHPAYSSPGKPLHIVIGTRPDCVDGEKLDWLAELKAGRVLKDWKRTVGGKEWTAPLVIIEYGIESCNDSTLGRINRGHDFACAQKAVSMTAERGIDTGAHFILGLPGETEEMLLSQTAMINDLP